MQNKFRHIVDYFDLNKREQRGMIILFLILIIIIMAKFLIPVFIQTEILDTSEFEARVLEFQTKQKQITDSLASLKKLDAEKTTKLFPFEFDPNNLSIEKWKKLGLSDQQISNIKNYEAKGGKFYKPEDLAKIYSISEKEFSILKPYINIKAEQNTPIEANNPPPITPSPFDPNTASAKEFSDMNFPNNLMNAIINYRNKGGNFRIKEDIKKIYVLTEEDYILLEPFINLPDHIETPIKPRIALSIDINSADTIDLQQITGVGPSFAKRILKYRNMLGGFCCKNQLMEVYGMDSVKYKTIIENIVIDKSNIHKININSSQVKGFIKHPYFEFYLAKSIITYREENGAFTDIEDVKNVKLIYDELFEKIKPYITLNEP